MIEQNPSYAMLGTHTYATMVIESKSKETSKNDPGIMPLGNGLGCNRKGPQESMYLTRLTSLGSRQRHVEV